MFIFSLRFALGFREGGHGIGQLTGFIKHLMKGTSLYVYNKDKSKLIYTFFSIRQAARMLPCSKNAIREALNLKRPLFGINFESVLIQTATPEYVSLDYIIEIMKNNIELQSTKQGGSQTKKPFIL